MTQTPPTQQTSPVRAALVLQARANPEKASVVLRCAIDLRETIYRIVAAKLASRRLAEPDRRAFTAALGDALSHLQLRATSQGFQLDWEENSATLEALLWPVVVSAARLLTSDDLGRVGECGSKTCRWMFVDRSKNHRRRWCDMKLCGNRTKARKFYRRAKSRSKGRSSKDRR